MTAGTAWCARAADVFHTKPRFRSRRLHCFDAVDWLSRQTDKKTDRQTPVEQPNFQDNLGKAELPLVYGRRM